MGRVNLTKRYLEGLETPKDKYELHRDSTVRGLGVKVEPTGTRSFFWTRKGGARTFWLTIGAVESVTLDDARAKASDFNSALVKWKQDGAVGEPPFAKPKSLSLDEIVTAYRDRHIKATAKRPDKAAKRIDSRMSTHVGDLRHRRIDQITKADVVALHEDINKRFGPYASNRVVQMLKAAINWAVDAGLWTGVNPAASVGMFPEQKRRRFLLPDELAALRAALDSPETSADLRDFVQLALYTGQRKMDVMSMAWRDIDLGRCVWFVPDPKNQQPFYVPLTTQAVAVLKDRLKQADRRAREAGLEPSGFVFPSHSASGHIEDLKKSWAELLKTAGIEELRQHDLRRTFGSIQAEGGSSLHIIGGSLGHKSSGSTAIYAQLQLEGIRKSAQQATTTMAKAMKKKQKPRRALPAAPAKKRARA